MALPHATFRFLRTIHLYLGAFAAPALFFMALTGGLQVFSLHETTRGSSYVPPAWLASAARLHKKQTLVVPQPKTGSAPQSQRIQPAAGVSVALTRWPIASGMPAQQWAMKVFFALISVSLMVSILTGVFMAYRGSRRPYLISALLVAGLVIPLVILVV